VAASVVKRPESVIGSVRIAIADEEAQRKVVTARGIDGSVERLGIENGGAADEKGMIDGRLEPRKDHGTAAGHCEAIVK
jgi:hypothetical protein